jgi:hypothetical protein
MDLKVLSIVSQLILVVALVDVGIGMRTIFLVILYNRHFLLILIVRLDALHTFSFIKFVVRLKGLFFFISKLLFVCIDLKFHTPT